MSEMVERVAAVFRRANESGAQFRYEDVARAAIEEIRELVTPNMRDAMSAAKLEADRMDEEATAATIAKFGGLAGTEAFWPIATWQAAIDAALKD